MNLRLNRTLNFILRETKINYNSPPILRLSIEIRFHPAMNPTGYFDRLVAWSRATLSTESRTMMIAVVISILICFYLVYTVIYGLFLCPTRHIPGPFITRFSRIPYTIQLLGNSNCIDIQSLHDKYGDLPQI